MMTGNIYVDDLTRAIGISLEGHVVPHSWHKHIRKPWRGRAEGKGDDLAKLILADVVYWYRATAVLEESTGRILRWEKRFAEDMLQRSYDGFASLFGATKEEVKNSCDLLRSLDLVIVQFRTVQFRRGSDNYTLPNVMFIAPNVSRLQEITYDILPHRKRTVPAGSPVPTEEPAPLSPEKQGGYPPENGGDTPEQIKGILPGETPPDPHKDEVDIPPDTIGTSPAMAAPHPHRFQGTITNNNSENASENNSENASENNSENASKNPPLKEERERDAREASLKGEEGRNGTVPLDIALRTARREFKSWFGYEPDQRFERAFELLMKPADSEEGFQIGGYTEIFNGYTLQQLLKAIQDMAGSSKDHTPRQLTLWIAGLVEARRQEGNSPAGSNGTNRGVVRLLNYAEAMALVTKRKTTMSTLSSAWNEDTGLGVYLHPDDSQLPLPPGYSRERTTKQQQ